MAFHLWDAVAFFSPSLETILNKSPSAKDISFQQTIQSLVKEFIHQPKSITTIRTLDQLSSSSTNNNNNNNKDTIHTLGSISVKSSNSGNLNGDNKVVENEQQNVTSDTSGKVDNTVKRQISHRINSPVQSSSSSSSSVTSVTATSTPITSTSKNLLPSASSDETLIIDGSNVSYITKYKEAQCNFWQSQGLLEYAWVS